jgi:hypothetical protein
MLVKNVSGYLGRTLENEKQLSATSTNRRGRAGEFISIDLSLRGFIGAGCSLIEPN